MSYLPTNYSKVIKILSLIKTAYSLLSVKNTQGEGELQLKINIA